MRAREPQISVKTLATACGVSIGSVDRALHDRSGISPLTRARIIAKAKELGYRPNLPARSLVTGRTRTVGIVVFDLTHAFFAELVTAAISRLRRDDYFASVAVSDKDHEEEKRCLERMGSLNVDGIIVLPINRGDELDGFLKSLGRPVVTVGNYVSESWPYVGIDYEKASYDAVSYIASRGYRRVVYLCPPLARKGTDNSYAVERRVDGYLAAMRETAGMEPPRVVTGQNYLATIEALDLRGGERTAILCSSDVYALKLLTYLTDRGLRIPGDVGLMGFDNIDTLRYVHPSIATVDCSIAQIGTRAAECLLAGLRGESVSPLVGHSIIPGQTL